MTHRSRNRDLRPWLTLATCGVLGLASGGLLAATTSPGSLVSPTPPQLIIDDLEPPEGSLADDVLAFWGGTGTQYDLNCDGVVNVVDMLGALGGEIDGEPIEFDLDELPDLLADFNLASHPYDLNCDGVVNTPDYLAALAGHTRANLMEVQATIDGVFAHWGQTGTPYDMNCNGLVEISDYPAVIQNVLDGIWPAEAYYEFLDALGQMSHPYDFDCDGVVGTTDALAVLGGITDEAG